MKPIIRISRFTLLACALLLHTGIIAQEDSTADAGTPAPVKAKPVKNTFESVWIIDNQTILVPVKGTLEMDIMHRFGTVKKGYQDFWGFFAPSNIRLGVSYAPVNRLFVGIGITKFNMLWDASVKYSVFTQTKGKFPVSLTYYGNAAYDTRKEASIYDNSAIRNWTDRMLFFNQLLIARKLSPKLSVQLGPSVSHQNAVSGYYTRYDSTGKDIYKSMRNTHFAVSFAARYKVTTVTSVMLNYDQPLTKHASNNPNPNLSVGVEFNTSNHSFQLFIGNYSLLNPQRNNLFNAQSPFAYTDKATNKKMEGGEFLIGFNITRLWNY